MSQKMTRETIIAHYFKVEGGKVNHKDDKGGLTGAGGITETLLKKYDHLWSKYNFHGDMDNIPYDLYEEIMTKEFWNKCWLDDVLEISPRIADCVYGWAINSGQKYPITALQKQLNVSNLKGTRYADIEPDGWMGEKTMEAFRAYIKTCARYQPVESMLATITAYQRVHYTEISLKREANETFTMGWYNRVAEKVRRLKFW